MAIGVMILFWTTCFDWQGWRLEESEDSIKVYSREVSDSRVRAFKGVMIVDESVEEIVRLFMDVPNGTEWIYQCRQSELVERRSNTEQFNYYIIKVPPPYWDRDMIMHFKMEKGANGSITVDITNAPDFLPENRRLHRVRQLRGYWKFVPLGDNQTTVTYELSLDPGSSIPAFLANRRAVKDPFYTLVGLRRLLRTHRYQKDN